MRRKTSKQPKLFEVGTEEFKTNRLGFLDTGEIMISYLPTILKIQGNLSKLSPDTETESEEDIKVTLDDRDSEGMAALIEGIPQNALTGLSKALLSETYFLDEGRYTKVDPDDFDSFTELGSVVFEVFKFNFPDFFEKGEDTPEKPQVSEPRKQSKQIDIQEKPERIDL